MKWKHVNMLKTDVKNGLERGKKRMDAKDI